MVAQHPNSLQKITESLTLDKTPNHQVQPLTKRPHGHQTIITKCHIFLGCFNTSRNGNSTTSLFQGMFNHSSSEDYFLISILNSRGAAWGCFPLCCLSPPGTRAQSPPVHKLLSGIRGSLSLLFSRALCENLLFKCPWSDEDLIHSISIISWFSDWNCQNFTSLEWRAELCLHPPVYIQILSTFLHLQSFNRCY